MLAGWNEKKKTDRILSDFASLIHFSYASGDAMPTTQQSSHNINKWFIFCCDEARISEIPLQHDEQRDYVMYVSVSLFFSVSSSFGCFWIANLQQRRP